ncbi:MAG: hypothetical protein AAGA56_16590 [Myxococcota bacterium]
MGTETDLCVALPAIAGRREDYETCVVMDARVEQMRGRPPPSLRDTRLARRLRPARVLIAIDEDLAPGTEDRGLLP